MTKSIESIIIEQSDFVRNSGYTVTCNSSESTVVMQHKSDDEMSVFLRGNEAEKFIENATNKWLDFDLTFEQCSFSEAKQHVECM